MLMFQITKLNSLQLDHLDAAEREAVAAIMYKIKQILQTDVMSSCVAAICGSCTQEAVPLLASLMHAVLQSSNWLEVEAPITSIFGSYQFKLGDECKAAVVQIFKRCSEGGIPASHFSDMIFDLWDMHQTDDTEATAGGQLVHDFIKKHTVNR